MIEWLNLVACVLTIAFGAFGFLAPRFTASALDLAVTSSTMGLSEMRASVGGLFVIAGCSATWLAEPMAYVMLGFCYGGAALGRAMSLALDSPPRRKVVIFGGIELLLAVWFIAANI